MNRGGILEGEDLFQGADAAPASQRAAIERGGSGGEADAPDQVPVLERTVEEAGTEDVAGAGGVYHGGRDIGGDVLDAGLAPLREKAAPLSVGDEGRRAVGVSDLHGKVR